MAACDASFNEEGVLENMQTLKGNVGRRPHRHCRNFISDQIAVVTLLNRIPEHLGGTGGKLQIKPIPGLCPEDLYKAIVRFQEINVGAIEADGIVEAGGMTLLFLNRAADLNLPVTTVDDAAQRTAINDRFLDMIIKTNQERAATHPREAQRRQQRKRQAALAKWRAWKQRLRREAGKNLYVKLAIDHLNTIEQRLLPSSEPSIIGWALGFGHAYVGYDYQANWEEKVMWGEMLATSYDQRTVLINTYGIKDQPPVILFANQTHYILKEDEVVELKQETYKVLTK